MQSRVFRFEHDVINDMRRLHESNDAGRLMNFNVPLKIRCGEARRKFFEGQERKKKRTGYEARPLRTEKRGQARRLS